MLIRIVCTQALPTLNTAIPSFPVTGAVELKGSTNGVLGTAPVTCAASPCAVKFMGTPSLATYLKKETLSLVFTPTATVPQVGGVPAAALSEVTPAVFTFPQEVDLI